MATPPFLSQIEGPVSFPGFFLPLSGIRIAHFSGFVNRKVYESVDYFTKDLLGRYNISFARRAGRGLAPGGRACYNGDVQSAPTKPYGKKGFSLKKLFALCLIVALLCAAAVAEEAPVRVGTLKGATTIGLVELMDRAEKGDTDVPYAFEMGTADAFMAQVVNGEIDIVTIPANAAAIWYNKLQGAVRVIDVNTLGVLYMVAAQDGIASMADLKGRTIASTGKGTTPEWILRSLLTANGLGDGDVNLEYKSEAAEVMQALATGAADLGLLPQPFVTAACAKNDQLRVVLDLTEEWNKAFPDSRLCTGVTVARTAFLKERPEAVAAFLADHAQSAAFANEHPAEAAELVVAAGIVENPAVAEKAIPKCNIVCLAGEDMKAALSGYLAALFTIEPSAVGGALPGEDFYFGA